MSSKLIPNLGATNFLNFITWTPTYSGLTVGNGTVMARYAQVGKLVHAEFSFQMGSTSTMGSLQVSLPIAPKNLEAVQVPGAVCTLLDYNVAIYSATAVYNPANKIEIYAVTTGGTFASIQSISSTTPFTWGTSDTVSFNITYEVA
jgi:hypothetical protein